MSLYDWDSLEKYKNQKIMEENQKKVFSHIDKMKSSINNKYCLYCRFEIAEDNHHCPQIEGVGDQIVQFYFEMDDKIRKEIIGELKNDLLANEEFAQNIRNKILAYSL